MLNFWWFFADLLAIIDGEARGDESEAEGH